MYVREKHRLVAFCMFLSGQSLQPRRALVQEMSRSPFGLWEDDQLSLTGWGCIVPILPNVFHLPINISWQSSYINMERASSIFFRFFNVV